MGSVCDPAIANETAEESPVQILLRQAVLLDTAFPQGFIGTVLVVLHPAYFVCCRLNRNTG